MLRSWAADEVAIASHIPSTQVRRCVDTHIDRFRAPQSLRALFSALKATRSYLKVVNSRGSQRYLVNSAGGDELAEEVLGLTSTQGAGRLPSLDKGRIASIDWLTHGTALSITGTDPGNRLWRLRWHSTAFQ